VTVHRQRGPWLPVVWAGLLVGCALFWGAVLAWLEG
jgi:hypothetical protein